MDEGGLAFHPAEQISEAFRLLLRRPYAGALLLALTIATASASIGTLVAQGGRSEHGYLVTLTSLLFIAVSIYLQIAVILAAGSAREERGEDTWKAAVRHRCFWRYLGVAVLVSFLVMVGALVLLVGAVAAGAILFVSQPAVVLERRNVGEAVRRSAELTRPVRNDVALIFAALSLPAQVGNTIVVLFHSDLGMMPAIGLSCASSILLLASVVAATRVFVKLRGSAGT